MFGSDSTENTHLDNWRGKDKLKVFPGTSRTPVVCLSNLAYNSTMDPGGIRREVLPLLQITLLHRV